MSADLAYRFRCRECVWEPPREKAREVAASDGVFLGASAAAALTAAKELALRPENEGKNIVAILADNGMKYLSTNMYK